MRPLVNTPPSAACSSCREVVGASPIAPPDFKAGDRCRVKPGHWAQGKDGIVESIAGHGLIVMRLSILGDSTPVEIGREHLEAID